MPFGPVIAGSYWLPFILVGLFVLLLLAAASAPPRPPRMAAEAQAEAREAETAGTVLSVFFWVLLVGLLIAILLSYLRDGLPR